MHIDINKYYSIKLLKPATQQIWLTRRLKNPSRIIALFLIHSIVCIFTRSWGILWTLKGAGLGPLFLEAQIQSEKSTGGYLKIYNELTSLSRCTNTQEHSPSDRRRWLFGKANTFLVCCDVNCEAVALGSHRPAVNQDGGIPRWTWVKLLISIRGVVHISLALFLLPYAKKKWTPEGHWLDLGK